MKGKFKKSLSLLLSLVLIFGCMSLPAFATENDEPVEQDEEVTPVVTLDVQWLHGGQYVPVTNDVLPQTYTNSYAAFSVTTLVNGEEPSSDSQNLITVTSSDDAIGYVNQNEVERDSFIVRGNGNGTATITVTSALDSSVTFQFTIESTSPPCFKLNGDGTVDWNTSLTDVASVNGTLYDSIEEALLAASAVENGKVVLEKSFATKAAAHLRSGKATLDLHGQTYKAEPSDTGALFLHNTAELIIQDSTDLQQGKIVSNKPAIILFTDGSPHLTLRSGKLETTEAEYAVIDGMSGTIDIEGGVLNHANDGYMIYSVLERYGIGVSRKTNITGGVFSSDPTDVGNSKIADGYNMVENSPSAGWYEVTKNPFSAEKTGDTGTTYTTVNDAITELVTSGNGVDSITTTGDKPVAVGSAVIPAGSTITTPKNAATATTDSHIAIQEVKIKKSGGTTQTAFAITKDEGVTLASATVGEGMDSSMPATTYVNAGTLADQIAAAASGHDTVNDDLKIEVKLDVKAPAKTTLTEEQQANKSNAESGFINVFDGDLWATTYVDGAALDDGVKVSDNIADGATFNVTLNVGTGHKNQLLKVVHKGATEDKDEVLYGTSNNVGELTVPATHFSDFEVWLPGTTLGTSRIGVAMALSEKITLKFLVPADLLDDQNATKYSLTLPARGDTVTITDLPAPEPNVKIDDDTTVDEAYVLSYDLPAQYYNDNVELRVYDASNDEIPVEIPFSSDNGSYATSAEDYLKAQISKDDSTELAALCKALHDYGLFAEQYFVNSASKGNTTGAYGAEASGKRDAIRTNANKPSDAFITGANVIEGMTFYGANLQLLSQVNLNLYFKLQPGYRGFIDKDYVGNTIEGNNGKTYTFTDNNRADGVKGIRVQQNSIYVVVTLKGVSPNVLDQGITITCEDDRGNEWSGTYGAFNYAYSALANKAEDDTVTYLLDALRRYNVAAKAYVGD